MKKKQFNILLVFILIIVCAVNKLPAQKVYDYSFERDLSVTVLDSAANPYNFPWVGGMNSCQFSTIDMNFDGIEDLFVFDRSRNKILTFINNGTPNTIDYYYAPEYERLFQQYPPLTDWVMLKDYNCDGKKDLIAYSPGGIRIYENTSDTTLKFKMLTFSLNTFYYMGYSNLYLSSVDFPGIADMDHDSDLDIMAFYILGVRIHYHINLAMEKHGRCDTLDYKLNHECWGYFTEHDNSNILFLNDSFCLSLSPLPKIPPLPVQEKIEKHSGSTMLLLDLNGDSLYDLLLGDVDYSNLIKVINGGTPDSTHMVSQDINFPSNTRPVDVKYFPVPSYIDIDNDSINELVVSPFDPQHYLSENDNCVWLYENNGVNNNPVFSFVKESFLQDEMIDLGGGAYPVIFDYNNDGLDDLVVSNFGRLDSSYLDPVWLTLHSFFRSSIALYENIGTVTIPKFKLITKDFANVSTLYPDSIPIASIYPTFGDIDGDGDKDMIIGNSDGKLHYFQNVAQTGNPASFVHKQIYQSIDTIDVGKFSAPQLIDLDRDLLLDLVIGERHGNLNYYRNTGTATNPEFIRVTDTLGNVDVTDINWSYDGYSIPMFFEDTLGKYKLFVGTEYGNIMYYKDIDSNLSGKFTHIDTIKYKSYNFSIDSAFLDISEGYKVGVCVNDLNNDGYLDMIVGTHAGGLNYYKGVEPPPPISGIVKTGLSNVEFNLFPNPARNQITLRMDGITMNTTYDIVVVNLVGKTIYSETIKGHNTISINVEDFSNGIYICNVSCLTKNSKEFFSISKKFIVQH